MGNATWLSEEIGWEIEFEKKVFGNSLFGRKTRSQASRVYRSQFIETIEKKKHKNLVSPMT